MQVSNPSTQTCDNFFIAHLHLCWPIWFSFDKWQGLQVASSLSPKHLEIDLSPSILELQSVSSAHTVPIYFSLHNRYNRVYFCFLFFLCVAFPDLPNPKCITPLPPKKADDSIQCYITHFLFLYLFLPILITRGNCEFADYCGSW